jgi:hypothetical protein
LPSPESYPRASEGPNPQRPGLTGPVTTWRGGTGLFVHTAHPAPRGYVLRLCDSGSWRVPWRGSASVARQPRPPGRISARPR